MTTGEFPLISVVVPVFNSEKYLDQCLTSILEQRYTNLEVILVDDGSSDNSLWICRKYEKADARVIVMHQRNSGQMVATRLGVNEAHGDYLSFIDSDDYILPDMFSTMVSEISLHGSDIVTIAGKSFNGNIEHLYADTLREGFYDRDAISSYIIPNMFSNHSLYGKRGIHSSKALKLFRASLFRGVINNLPLDIQMGEDLLCTYSCLIKAESISILPRDKVGYMYRLNTSSISWVYKKDLFSKSMKLCNFLRSIPEVNDNKHFQSEMDYEVCFFSINAFLNEYLMKNPKRFSDRRFSVGCILNSPEFKTAIMRVDIRQVKFPNNVLLKLMKRHSRLLFFIGYLISLFRIPILAISQRVL